jgi:hypothetical protein
MTKADFYMTPQEHKEAIYQRRRAMQARKRWSAWDEIVMLQEGDTVRLKALREMFARRDSLWQAEQAMFCRELLFMANCQGRYKKAVMDAMTARSLDWAAARAREAAS